METFLSSNPKRTKEKLLTFLLVFLILLVPLSLLSKSSGPNVEITGLYTQSAGDASQRVFFEIRNIQDYDMHCKIIVTYFKNNAPYEKKIEEFGVLKAHEAREGSLFLEFPPGQSSMKIEPDCFAVSP